MSNRDNAPLLEIIRKNGNSMGDGRVYWSKLFAAPDGVNYDIEEFSQWFETVAKWIRKNAGGKVNCGRTTYYLPEAWIGYKSKEK